MYHQKGTYLDMVKTQNRYRKLNGQKFGRLNVLFRDWERTSPKNRWKVYWKCQCDCGTICSVRAEHLKDDGKSHTRSCGCLQREKARENGKRNALPIKEYACRNLYSSYRQCAQQRCLTFSLTRDLFDALIQSECFYCGKQKSNTHKHKRHENKSYDYNGIDRIDPTKGYSSENVVPCCDTCNRAKLSMTLDEFHSWIKRVYHHSTKKYETHSNDSKSI